MGSKIGLGHYLAWTGRGDSATGSIHVQTNLASGAITRNMSADLFPHPYALWQKWVWHISRIGGWHSGPFLKDTLLTRIINSHMILKLISLLVHTPTKQA